MKKHANNFVFPMVVIILLLVMTFIRIRDEQAHNEEIMELDIALQKAEQRAENNEMMMYEAYEDNFELYDQLRQIRMNQEAEMYMEDAE